MVKLTKDDLADAIDWPESDEEHEVKMTPGVLGPDTLDLAAEIVNQPFTMTVVSWVPKDVVLHSRMGALSGWLNFNGRGFRSTNAGERRYVAETLRVLAAQVEADQVDALRVQR